MVERAVGKRFGRPCLVTGAAGLVGGHLVEALVNAGANVIALVKEHDRRAYLFGLPQFPSVTVVSGDLTDLPLITTVLEDHDVDMVFHLGAQTQVREAWQNPLETFETNLRGVWVIMEAARRRRGRTSVMFASSDKAYGPSAHLPYVEEMRHRPTHPYDTSKSCGEAVAGSYATSYGVPLLITRCANLYGPGDLNVDRLIPGVILDLLDGRRPVIRSDGSPRRDFLYVVDAVRAMMALAAGGVAWNGAAYNIGSELPRSVLEVVAAVNRAVAVQDLIADVRGEAVGELADQYLNAGKLKTATGWAPEVDFDVGLGITVNWYASLHARGLLASPSRSDR